MACSPEAVGVEIERALVASKDGMVHYRSCGRGPALVLLHQTADSSREFLKMMPGLGRHYRVIAMDTLGYGDSDPAKPGWSMQDYARSVASFLDAIEVEQCAILGNHTGATIAVEFAACFPTRITALVGNGLTLWDASERARLYDLLCQPITPKLDGSHLLKFWEKARYASDPPLEIIQRGVLDVMKAPDFLAAYEAVFSYNMAERLPLVTCPTLVVAGEHDPMSKYSETAASMLARGVAKSIAGAKFFLADLHLDVYLPLVLNFLHRHVPR